MHFPPVILGFDLRASTTHEFDGPFTADVNIWPQIDEYSFKAIRINIAADLGREEAALVSPLDMSLLNCIPRNWLDVRPEGFENVCLVAFSSSTIGPSRQAYRVDLSQGYYGCDISYEELIESGWISLGYDVCDDSLSASLLHTYRQNSKRAPKIESEFRNLVNQYGLFGFEKHANDFASLESSIMPDHVPFSAVEILVAGYTVPREQTYHGTKPE